MARATVALTRLEGERESSTSQSPVSCEKLSTDERVSISEYGGILTDSQRMARRVTSYVVKGQHV